MRNFNKKLIGILILVFLIWGQIPVSATINQSSIIKLKRNGIYELKYAGLSIKIDSSFGGRIRSFKLGKREILSSSKVHNENFGSTLWISPQKWKWPPSPILDKGNYKAELNKDTLTLHSNIDTLSAYSFKKSFYIDKEDTCIVIKYQIFNASSHQQKVAPWEVTRVNAGGISFFPKGAECGFFKSNLHTCESEGIIWFDYDPDKITHHQKLFSDGSEGWLAHVNNGLLFIKQFNDIKPAEQAPKEAEVEIYANKDRTYIELESQGEYKTLQAGESLEWEVKWFLKDISELKSNDKSKQYFLAIVRKTIK